MYYDIVRLSTRKIQHFIVYKTFCWYQYTLQTNHTKQLPTDHTIIVTMTRVYGLDIIYAFDVKHFARIAFEYVRV